jgi:hypothetical protein
MFDHRYTPIFNDCLERYRTRPEIMAAVSHSLMQLALKPFGNPQLQTHAVRNAQPDTFTSRVANSGHRLIWRRVGHVLVLLLFGEHDAVYRRAQKLKLEIDDAQHMLRIFDEDPATEKPIPYQDRRADEGKLFMAWNDADLAGFGFEPQEVPVLRRLNTDDELTSLDGHMRPDAWTRAMNLAMYANPDGTMSAAPEDSEPAVATEPTEAADPRLAEALEAPEASPEFVHVAADRLADVLTRPIEDWMVYLDPAQQDLVDRNYNGPARIRGAAGTGKTVVALHRARSLAAKKQKVLITTYVRNLPEVYDHIFERWAPTERQSVHFSGVHSWANKYLRRNHADVRLDPKEAAAAWRSACNRVAGAGSALHRAGLTSFYLQEEVDWVVRGRALPDLDAYLGLERNGRGTPLSRDLRQEVWRLSQEYAAELDKRGIADYTDVLLKAYDIARHKTPEYDAVIIDEAQDLTDVALRLLFTLVGNRPNGLLLVGDGQQSVYPGGFNLLSLGIDVRGRSHVLTRNYRNTREVFAAALSVVGDHGFDDGEAIKEPGTREVEITRTGPPPEVSANATDDEHDLALISAIETVIEDGTSIGDVAVLVATNALVERYAGLIDDRGLPTQLLKSYDGRPSAEIKIGTYQRAKGLEFKHVFLPRLEAVGKQGRRGADVESQAEHLAKARRQLFVAMSRARDGIWLGWVGEPSPLLPLGLTATARKPVGVRRS